MKPETNLSGLRFVWFDCSTKMIKRAIWAQCFTMAGGNFGVIAYAPVQLCYWDIYVSGFCTVTIDLNS